MTIINEQIAIVKHYLENMNEYRLDNGEWWENLKKLKLKDKSETYVNKVDELINEWVDNGKKSFLERYTQS